MSMDTDVLIQVVRSRKPFVTALIWAFEGYRMLLIFCAFILEHYLRFSMV